MNNAETYHAFKRTLYESIEEINRKKVMNLAFKRLLDSYPSNNGEAVASIFEVDLEEAPESDKHLLSYCMKLDDKLLDLEIESQTLSDQINKLDGVLFIDGKFIDKDTFIIRVFDEQKLTDVNFLDLARKAANKVGLKDNYSQEDFMKVLDVLGGYIDQAADEFGIQGIDYRIEDE